MPPLFLALPLRQMMLPFIGPFPVISQNLPIIILNKERRTYQPPAPLQAYFPYFLGELRHPGPLPIFLPKLPFKVLKPQICDPTTTPTSLCRPTSARANFPGTICDC